MPTREDIRISNIEIRLRELIKIVSPAAIINALHDVWIRHANLVPHPDTSDKSKRKGKCFKCHQYGHVQEECQSSKTSTHTRPACRDFIKGACNRGESCRFTHDESSLPPTKKPGVSLSACSRCGRNNHSFSECVAKSDMQGNVLPDVPPMARKDKIKASVARTRTVASASALDDLNGTVCTNTARVKLGPVGYRALLGKVKHINRIPNGHIFDTGATSDVSSSMADLEDYCPTPNFVVEGVDSASHLPIQGVGRRNGHYNTQIKGVVVSYHTLVAVVADDRCNVDIIGANKLTTTDASCDWIAHLEYGNSFLEHKTLKYSGVPVRIPIMIEDGLPMMSVFCRDELPPDTTILDGGGLNGSVRANVAAISAMPVKTRQKTMRSITIKPGMQIIQSGKLWDNEPARYCEGMIVARSQKELIPNGYYSPGEPLWEAEFYNPTTGRYDLYDVCECDITTTKVAADERGRLYRDWVAAGCQDLH